MRALLMAAAAALLAGGALLAQDAPPSANAPPPAPRVLFQSPIPLGVGPWTFQTENGPIKVSVLLRGIERPWAMAFLPGGDILLTEQRGRLRVIRGGKLDPVAIAGLPPILRNLMGLALHPDFARNRLIYFSYTKPGDPERDNSTMAVARARWDGGMTLRDVKEIFVADAWFGGLPVPARCCGQGPPSGGTGARIAFGPDGKLYVASGDRDYGERAQDPSSDLGKILRINDDGTIPRDNPFFGRKGYKPEIWTVGHRNPSAMTFHPVTRTLWESEFGPRGGDELNLIEKGRNYGWIDVTQGAHYNGEPAKGVRNVPGMTDPVLAWAPSINPGGLDFYYGDKFPGWRGDMLMGTMIGALVRVSFDAHGRVTGQERLLGDLRQRIRDVHVGPDGNVYLITDDEKGGLLKIEPGQ